MARRLDQECRVVIKKLGELGVANTTIAEQLSVTEGAVRYHRRRQEMGAIDGRSLQSSKAKAVHEAIAFWVSDHDADGLNLVSLHSWLQEEHGFQGSLRCLQRYIGKTFPRPRVRARRRVETPPGAQAQADWAVFPRVTIRGEVQELVLFVYQLSHSRYAVAIWSERRDQLAWLHVHNEALRRIGGVAATIRIDNEKTAISRGAGAFGEINPTYRGYATAVRFHIDACQPRSPEAKGKVERRILDTRSLDEVLRRDWPSFEDLQAWTDDRMVERSKKRVCPATGTTVQEAFEEEQRSLGTLPVLPEPFDVVVTRPVSKDCMIAFEGRTYSVPFHLIGQLVEVRGAAGRVQVVAGGRVVGCHKRHTEERILIDQRHFEGEATTTVLPPLPLGRMGRRVQEIFEMVPEQRPVDLYAALAEVAR